MDLLVELQLLSTKCEARRMIENRGMKVNGNNVEVSTLRFTIKDDAIVQIGKHKFAKLKLKF